MNDTAYLIFNRKGIVRMAKGGSLYGTRKRPALGAGEFAVQLEVNVPEKFFAERPLPTAVLNVPERSILEPEVIVQVLEPPV